MRNINRHALVLLIAVELFTILFIWQNAKRANPAFKIPPYKVPVKMTHFYEPTLTQEKHTWLPVAVKYTINKDKLNDRYDYSQSKDEGTYRILTIGDSFTFGENVNTEQNWTELLEDELNRLNCSKRFEVINLGMYGYGTEYEVERYRRRGQKYDPDLIIWTFVDFGRFNEEIETIIDILKSNPRVAQENIGIFKSTFKNEIPLYPIKDVDLYWDIARKHTESRHSFSYISDMENYYLNQFKKMYKGPVIATTFKTKDNFFFDRIVKSRMKKKQFFVMDYSFGLHERMFILPDGHLNRLGHMKVMDELRSFMKKNDIIKCPN